MKNSQKIQKLTILAILSALIVVLAFIPVRIFFEITLTIIPIAVGAIVLGPTAGLILGGVFGVVSFLQCLGYSPLGVALLSINPFLTFIVCVPTRMLAGYLPGLLYKVFTKNEQNKTLFGIICSFLVPLLNTVFFMGTLVLFFYNSSTIQGYVDLLKAANPFHFILLFVGVNGLVEILVGVLVSFPIIKTLEKIRNNN